MGNFVRPRAGQHRPARRVVEDLGPGAPFGIPGQQYAGVAEIQREHQTGAVNGVFKPGAAASMFALARSSIASVSVSSASADTYRRRCGVHPERGRRCLGMISGRAAAAGDPAARGPLGEARAGSVSGLVGEVLPLGRIHKRDHVGIMRRPERMDPHSGQQVGGEHLGAAVALGQIATARSPAKPVRSRVSASLLDNELSAKAPIAVSVDANRRASALAKRFWLRRIVSAAGLPTSSVHGIHTSPTSTRSHSFKAKPLMWS